MPGILDRISTILRSNINSMLDKAEDPEKMLDQIIRDMNDAIEQAKGQVATVIAQEKQLEAERINADRQAKEWDDKAQRAVKAGRDDLAVECLRRKKDFENISQTYQQQYDAQHGMVTKLRSQLELLMRKRDDAARNRDVMIARHRQAVAQQNISKQLAAMSGLDHSSEMARMDRRIREQEARAAAEMELNSGATASIDDQLMQLEAGDTMDDELKALKSRMGIGGAQ
ncbi:MAG TPA: PspA/IM30 family protein [Chloroflexia bacterium]|nr:PspA/IM30 family protein [Chloroflexia bacterium]